MKTLTFEQFDLSPEEILDGLADRLHRRRLEKGYSRITLQSMAGVPAPTIARFENTARTSLESFVRLAAALGYGDEMKTLLSEAKYSTMDEMESIKRNRNRKRGTRRCSKGS